MSDEDQRRQFNALGASIAIGAGLGAALGAGVGAASDNIGFWVRIGVAIGA